MRQQVIIAIACLSMAGCSGLLPRGSGQAASPFADFQAARDALERVTPYETTAADLKALGFDLEATSNVRQIPYPEVIARLSPNSNVPMEALDPGIRDCIHARQACRAYELRIERQTRTREGAFLPDFLNFRRTTVTQGWRFEGLFVLRDGIVVFRNYGGEPSFERTDRQVNPLGPLQPAGEAVGAALLR